MSGQQNQKGGGNNAPKAGISVVTGVAPENIADNKALSDVFIIGGLVAAGALVLRFVAQPIKKVLFGLSDSDAAATGVSLSNAKGDQIVGRVKELHATAPGQVKFIAKEALGVLSDADKTNVVDAIIGKK